MNILFIGDIMGKIGRLTIKKVLPKLKKEEKIDLVIANIENAAHGSGATETIIKELLSYGIDFFTNGDHSFARINQVEIYEKYPIIRPANWANDVPGKGCSVVNCNGNSILIVNLIGRTFMKLDHDCPFHKINEILANFANQKLSAIIIDMHAEASSEKVALKHCVNGKVSAVPGTHTHVMTADERISSKGTAFITDVGMVGAYDECIGLEKEGIIKTFLTQIKYPHVLPEKGEAIFNAIMLKINPKTRKTNSIKPIIKYVYIK